MELLTRAHIAALGLCLLVGCAGPPSPPSVGVATPPPTRAATAPPPPTAAPTATATETPSPPPSATPTATAEPAITLAAVGDIMLGRSIGAALQRDPSGTPFADIVEQLRAPDITVGNLECALGMEGKPAAKGYTFLGPPSGAASLAGAGFDIVSLANNHSLDFGPRALDETIQLLDAAGIRHTGAGQDAAAAHQPAMITANGLRLAFLAYVNVPIERSGFDTASWEATGDQPGLAWARPRDIAVDVAAARARADLVIVLLHSGVEGQQTPDAAQKAAAHTAIDAGAALVIGAHPHVLQGVERYHGGLIAYSLGNIVFDGLWGNGIESAILRVTLTREGVRDVAWTPVVLRQGYPRLAEGVRADAIMAQIERMTARLAH